VGTTLLNLENRGVTMNALSDRDRHSTFLLLPPQLKYINLHRQNSHPRLTLQPLLPTLHDTVVPLLALEEVPL
jgi:hypothetical protein